MKTVTDYNIEKKFAVNLKESRLKKCVKLMEPMPPGKLLDIGCSRGDWSLLWREKGWQPYGVDVDREHLDIARERGVDAQFCDLNKEALPFESNTFDLIFAGEIIEHIVDTDHFIQETYRCLRKGGHLIVTTPNLASFENRLRLLFGIYPIWVNYDLSGAGHVRAYTPRVLKKQLRKHGYTVRKQTGNWVPFLPQKLIDDVKMPALSITGTLLPNLAMDIILLAQK